MATDISSNPSRPSPAADRSWYITQRWQQYAGEARVNLLRIASVGIFYLIHLWHYFGTAGKLPNWGVLQLSKEAVVDERFHTLVTLLALAWVMLAAAVHICLQMRHFPAWLPYASTAGDLVFLTGMLSIASGPRSALVAGYFLIVAMTALRFDLKLVRLATIGGMVGYLCVLGVAKWPATFGREATLDISVPRYHQLMTLAALALTGIIIGQAVRRVRFMAEEFAQRSDFHEKLRS